ncbi:hypothetical protein Lepto7376_4233 [[Leptolyngbya] sp. PCC 7376]|uniref:four-carbon acid sugar kinase family protein n=1 Tax=[Leptolyngbya] sp. PCC 7376 TaxID=111781 RepID=UPI00029ECFAB|nr:four-carbon acid sugar kinase family protein [[Leptolyngbya] sp. PCC 7376]AFY40347.1 hypothetical protein Lepto7376_4233 [[Leptolyngbya] sp. PCC 7376]
MRPKIIVLDDDPTGSQTVHSCSLLLRWDVAILREALQDPAPIFFILANTRAMNESEAIATTKEICRNLKAALAAENITDYWLVSRSDSTLRGHFPAETEAIASIFGEFDACFHAPAFFEGGRITRDGTHYIATADSLTPVHETEFAKDRVFGFKDSFLPNYIAEKTNGAIAAKDVDILEPQQSSKNVDDYLLGLSNNKQVVLSATTQQDFDQLVNPLQAATNKGKKFLFRSAASLLTSLANVGKQPVPAEKMATYRQSKKNGIIFVGSYVQKTTDQLTELLQLDDVRGIEIDIYACQNADQRKKLVTAITTQLETLFAKNITPVLFTQRTFQTQKTASEQMIFGQNINQCFQEILLLLPPDLGFIISKGGNTTNQLLSRGLALKTVQLLGQILPGCCLVKTSDSHPKFSNLPIVLFPGNVGDRQGLITTYKRLHKL